MGDISSCILQIIFYGGIMNIIIVGCGQVGQNLAEQLIDDGNNVTVIDKLYENVKSLTDRVDAMGIVGNGASHVTLAEADIEHADLLIAVTNSDELNLLCCTVAKKTSNCKVIARVRSHVYNDESAFLKSELGLAMVINPEYVAAEEIARVLRSPSAISVETFGKGKVELLKYRLPEDSAIIGMSVKDVMTKYKSDILFATIERADKAYIAKGDFIFAARDIVSIIASPDGSQDFFKKVGSRNQSVKSAMIVGSGEITHYLCSILKKSKTNIKVIEKDKALCDEISTSFPHVTVVHGDTTNQQIMAEEGISRVGAFLALSDSDEENMILSLHAKEKTKGKIVTKVTRIDYDSVIDRLNLDTVIYPKTIVSDMIIRYVRSAKNTRGSNMETLYNVIKGEVEASEFIIRQPSSIVGVPISKLRFRKNVLVAAILRDGEVIIPRGYDTIEIGDAVVIVSKVTGLQDVTDILE